MIKRIYIEGYFALNDTYGLRAITVFFNFAKNIPGIMSVALNNTQLEILKLFSHDQAEDDLKELKSLLVTYLADKVVRTADKAFDEKYYSVQ